MWLVKFRGRRTEVELEVDIDTSTLTQIRPRSPRFSHLHSRNLLLPVDPIFFLDCSVILHNCCDRCLNIAAWRLHRSTQMLATIVESREAASNCHLSPLIAPFIQHALCAVRHLDVLMAHGNSSLNIPVALQHAVPCFAGQSPMLDSPISMILLGSEGH